ncbi:uncharacterized protein TM35_000015240 [Trypanosoma theileri]|uniref:Uncharacterized protein n=1 Tax=Trypanosoma theileri TaxID=67003 RepID=A0A1X0P9N6_9TRYP|nr:uncharacterized protein TM35_000015240 [Trypanosoma theileri]ORC93647.1 hypothetical protein TM35_000015240 [Trypanosoma theileri]
MSTVKKAKRSEHQVGKNSKPKNGRKRPQPPLEEKIVESLKSGNGVATTTTSPTNTITTSDHITNSTSVIAVVSDSVSSIVNDGSSLKSIQGKDFPTEKSPTSDPIYRIMHTLPRSDFLEIVKCRFGHDECKRAASYFDVSYMKNPLRHLRLQIGCDRPTGLHLFFPKLYHHRSTLRLLDLSRNDMDEDDVATLTDLLNLRNEKSSEKTTTVLEVLDLSYNRRIGNCGALFLLNALSQNDQIRALILRGISLDDNGALCIAPLLRQRPQPCIPVDTDTVTFQETSSRRPPTFFLNLNENRIGAAGTRELGKGLPVHVSLTLCKQRPICNKR